MKKLNKSVTSESFPLFLKSNSRPFSEAIVDFRVKRRKYLFTEKQTEAQNPKVFLMSKMRCQTKNLFKTALNILKDMSINL